MLRLLLSTSVLLLSAAPLAAASPWVTYSQGVLAITFIGFLLLLGIFSLAWSYRHQQKEKKGFLRFAWSKPLVKLSAACLGLVLLVNAFVGSPLKDGVYENLEFARYRKLHALGAGLCRELAWEYPYIAAYHYDYVSAYYEADAWRQRGESIAMHDDEELSPIRYYSDMLVYAPARLHDYAHLGMGMSEFFEDMHAPALMHLEKVRKRDLPYLNLFIARIHAARGLVEDAKCYYRQEFQGGGARAQAVKEYAGLIYQHERYEIDKLRALVDDPEIGAMVPSKVRRNYYVREAHLGSYIVQTLRDWSAGVNPIGFMGALLGVLVWAGFLRKLDGRGTYGWPVIAAVVGAGGLFGFLALPLYDYLEFVFDFRETGEAGQDFLFCWFGIGMVEELVKFIPVLLLARTTALVRTPMDWVVYAALSALGFAFIENLMYFEPGSEGIIHARLLMAVVGHVFLSTTVAFGIVLGQFRWPGWAVPMGLAGYVVAALLHGLWDFFAIGHGGPLVYVLLLFETFQLAAYFNTCLNHPTHYNPRRLPDPNGLAVWLLSGLVLLLMFEFLSMSMVYGPRIGTSELLQNLSMGSFIIFFLVMNLTNIDVVRGEWAWIRPWSFQTRHNHNAAVGRQLTLQPQRSGSVLNGMLPARGEVIARVNVGGDNRYFLFRFDQPAKLLGHPLRHILIRSKDRDDVIEPDYQMEVTMVAFRDEEALTRSRQRKQDFKFIDYAVVR